MPPLADLNAKKDVAHSFRPTQSTVRPNFSPLLLKKINDGLEDADAETAGLERVLHGLKELRAFCRDPEHAGEVLLSGGLVVACKAAQYQNPKVPELSAQVQVQALGLIAKLKRTAEAPGDEAEAAEERWLETMERDWLKAATNQGA